MEKIVFQQPEYLWAMVLCGLPLGIWLLVRRRAPRLDWAAMRFLREAIQETRAKRRWRELFFVALQTAAVFFLVLSLAGPGVAKPKGTFTTGETVFLFLDDSGSMNSLFTNDTTRWETVLQILQRHFADVPEGRRVTFSGRPMGNSPTTGTPDATAAFARMIQKVRALPQPVRVYLFTDGLWKTERSEELLKKLEETAAVTVIPLFSKSENLATTALVPNYAPVPWGGKVTLRAVVENVGEKSRKGVPGAWVVSDSDTQTRLSRTWLDVPPQEVVETVLEYVPDGKKRVEFRLEDTDGNAADNARKLDFAAKEGVRFLIVETWEPDFAKKKGAAGSFYLEAALQSRYVDRLTAGRLENVQTRTVRDADLTRISLDDIDVVFLLGERVLTAEEREVLGKYRDSGGAIVRFAADSDATWAINDARILPCVPGKRKTEDVKIAPDGYRHLWLAPFRGHVPTGLEAMVLPEYFPCEPHLDAEVILKFTNGAPFAVVKNRVLWLSMGAGTETPLPLTPLYLPLLDGFLTGLCIDRMNVVENFSPEEIQRKNDVPFDWHGSRIPPSDWLSPEATVSPWWSSGLAFLALLCVLLETTLRMLSRERKERHG